MGMEAATAPSPSKRADARAARSVGLGSPREACAKRPLVASWGLGPRVRRAVRCSCDSAKRAGVQRGGGERHWEVRVTSLGWKGAQLWALSRLGVTGPPSGLSLNVSPRRAVPGMQPKHSPVRCAGPTRARTTSGRAVLGPGQKKWAMRWADGLGLHAHL